MPTKFSAYSPKLSFSVAINEAGGDTCSTDTNILLEDPATCCESGPQTVCHANDTTDFNGAGAREEFPETRCETDPGMADQSGPAVTRYDADPGTYSDTDPATVCEATQPEELRRDIRPPTSLFGAFSASETESNGDHLPASAAGADSNPGASQLEHFAILRRADGTDWELGRGAMGVTYKALDTRLHCHVALKRINADLLARSPNVRERFLREARAAARLRHPNVASVFHLGESPAGDAFYAMEFIEGETLDARVRRRGPLPVDLAIEVGIEVARALIAAGQHRLVHRDLKPANLMLVAGMEEAFLGAAPTGRSVIVSTLTSHTDAGGALVKVIDFGLAKAASDAGPTSRRGAFLGTPQFASPEQFAGADGEIDVRSDIFSLGATLWFALTGKLAFPGRTGSAMRDDPLSAALPTGQLDAAGVPTPVAKLLSSMLAADPADRPQTPFELLEALRQCRTRLSGGGVAARSNTPQIVKRLVSMHPYAVAPASSGSTVVLASAVVLAMGLCIGLWSMKEHHAALPPSPPAAAATVVPGK